MNKVASYLQSHISGEVLIGEPLLERFSCDASIVELKPNLIVYPRTTNDVRKAARFTWQLAERGHVMPMTSRGNGTDLTGAAIGRGMIMSFTAHLNQILELDTKQKMVRVQPGVNFKSLQETLHTHGLSLPSAPESQQYSTVGGAIANNAAGIRSQKYGDMRDWVDRLEIVLANGEVIQTGPQSKKELNKKLGLPTLEGELYRALDALLTDGESVIEDYASRIGVSADNVGYALHKARYKGQVDLTPLFVGSQGTLGIITEAIIKVEPFSPQSMLMALSFGNLDDALEVAEKIVSMKPSVLDIVDNELLSFVKKQHNIVFPDELLVQGELPAAMMFVETDDPVFRSRARFAKKVSKVAATVTDQIISTEDFDEIERLWAYRYTTASYMSYSVGGQSAIPLVEHVAVPMAALHQFVDDAKKLAKQHHFEIALWFQVPSGCVSVLPLADLSKVGDRQQAMKFMDEYFRMVIKLGGSIAASSSEGRTRASYAVMQLGPDMVALNGQLRLAADPHGTLNPGVKSGTTEKELVAMLRKSYSFKDFADFLPRL
jgi:FAD/FMN-containing dehydrogenase